MKEISLHLIGFVFFNSNLITRVWNTHFKDFIIFSLCECDSFPEEISGRSKELAAFKGLLM